MGVSQTPPKPSGEEAAALNTFLDCDLGLKDFGSLRRENQARNSPIQQIYVCLKMVVL